MRVKAFDFDGKRIVLTFDKRAKIEPNRIVNFVSRSPDRIRFSPGFRLRIRLNEGENMEMVVRDLCGELISGRKDLQDLQVSDVSIVE